MDSLTPTDEILNKGFILAHFINGNRATAIRIVLSAVNKLQVTATAQDKRLYYKPIGRLFQPRRSNGLRNKVMFDELHLLQRLIYIESEPFEKQKEKSRDSESVDDEEMIIHFIKHLVRITLKRNSFYVALGISRLLHTYTTAETMGIYNVVIQDPERVKDDYYYRSRKAVLMQEMKERFGDLLQIRQGQRGEERFQAEPNPGKFVTLVRECLTFFTPWATSCAIPANFDPIMNGVPAFSYRDETVEDEAELNRIHAVLHPECYRRLTTALGFQAPDERLDLPHFHFSNQSRDGGETMRSPTVGLSKEELTTIKKDLDELAERRKEASAGSLQVLVDGKEYARLDLKKVRNVRFNLVAGNELIEIWTNDRKGDVLLASHLLTADEPGAISTSIVLEGGRQLSIAVSPSKNASDRIVDVDYRETNPFKARSLVYQRVVATLGAVFEGRSRVLIPVSAAILLVVITAGVLTYWQRKDMVASRQESSALSASDAAKANDTSNSSQTEGSIQQQPTAQSSESTGPPQPQNASSLNREKQSRPNETAARQRTSAEPSSAESRFGVDEPTRGMTRAETRLSLLNVKSVFVEAGNEETANQILIEVLVRKLRSGGRLILSQSRDRADAVLRVSTTRKAGTPSAQSAAPVFSVQLINAQGHVIWPRRLKVTYSGPMAEQIGSQILQDLLADIEQQKRRR